MTNQELLQLRATLRLLLDAAESADNTDQIAEFEGFADPNRNVFLHEHVCNRAIAMQNLLDEFCEELLGVWCPYGLEGSN